MKKIYEMTAKELHQSFLSGEYSAVEIVEAFFQRIEAVEKKSTVLSPYERKKFLRKQKIR
ncbi:hypothetical protein HMPREF9466_00424 [Fusobacterium necrophorum subsp. funduliforme 1_1_36S]|nr:hypothetical protein HMPREF9466_00424 [Fusobacterium necrophorum subsp. funduliforme 1_1_36S]